MSAARDAQAIAAAFEAQFGYVFNDPSYIAMAVSHTSFVEETDGVEGDNQRLEFLGDAVVGMVVTDALYRLHPDSPEGVMSKMKASLVSTASLAQNARTLDLGRWLLLGRGEEQSDGRKKRRMLANLFEAVVGAVFLDGGIEVAQPWVIAAFGERLSQATPRALLDDHKSALQELAQGKGWERPEYVVDDVTGPAHQQTFRVSVSVGDGVRGTGSGHSKKHAQQAAAQAALQALTSNAGDTMQGVTMKGANSDVESKP